MAEIKENKEWTVFIDFTLCYKVNIIQGTKLLVFLEKQQHKSGLKVQQNKRHTCLLCLKEKGREKEEYYPRAPCHCYHLSLMVPACIPAALVGNGYRRDVEVQSPAAHEKTKILRANPDCNVNT